MLIYKHFVSFVAKLSTCINTSSSRSFISTFCFPLALVLLQCQPNPRHILLHIAPSAWFTMNRSSRKRQNGLHELIVVDLDPSIPIAVQLGERLADLLDHDAGPDESVEGNTRSGSVTCGHPAGFNILPSSVKVQVIREEKIEGPRCVGRCSGDGVRDGGDGGDHGGRIVGG